MHSETWTRYSMKYNGPKEKKIHAKTTSLGFELDAR